MSMLRKAREEKSWTQDELAKRAGVSRTTISQIENNKVTCVKTDTLVKLADALEQKASALFLN